MNFFRMATVPLALLAVASASAVNIITNGDFEATPADSGWTKGGDPLFGNYGGFDPLISQTNSAFLAGYDNADDWISQSATTAPIVTASLKFTFTQYVYDYEGYDFFTVTVNGTDVYALDLGDDLDYDYYKKHDVTLDLTSLLAGATATDVKFRVTTDGSLTSAVWLDDVSLDVDVEAVPEPASMAALGFGALAVLRRRRSA